MKIAILGNGKEGKAVREYFEAQGDECQIFENFTDKDIDSFDLNKFDEVFRSPSVRPRSGWNSSTKYFLENCPCPIIGVTGTKGKGTTCSLISSILKSLGKKTWLVGNIGNPAITELDKVSGDDVVVYELSSFQLWDLERSPNVAVVLPIEPDHLNVHKDFDEYVEAKSNIARWQKADDCCIYNSNNEFSVKIANTSVAQKLAYPIVNKSEKLISALNSLSIVGEHNRENAEAALLAVAAYFKMNLDEFLAEYFEDVCVGLRDFKGLPHRLEFLRELNHVRYFDDNFATNVASTSVAVKAFPDDNLVMIVGGRDKTDNEDLPELYDLLMNSQIKKVILMGESGHELASRHQDKKFIIVESLKEAVLAAKSEAEKFGNSVVLMSPAAASFDMFENVYDRGGQFQKLISELK